MPAPVESGADAALRLTDNRLLAFLPPAERDRLAARTQIVHLEPLEVICRPGEPITHAYFPLTGLLSMFARLFPDDAREQGA